MIYNKHGIEISGELLSDYYNNLVKDFYKILPIYEGRDMRTKEIVCSPEEAYINYRKYIDNLFVEISGGYCLFDNIYFLKLLDLLLGMKDIDENQHDKVKSLVFHCIDVCKKMINKVR